MATQMQEWLKIGNELGYKGTELQTFVKEQQTIARDEREKERAFEKEKTELEKEKAEIAAKLEKEKAELIHEREMAIIEKQRLEVAEKGKRDIAELEIKMMKAKSQLDELKEESGRYMKKRRILEPLHQVYGTVEVNLGDRNCLHLMTRTTLIHTYIDLSNMLN
jgi:hypothetical protein